MAEKRPYVVTIAGHDPSSGAGLNADIKTFEQHKVQGLSVCTAITVQTDDKFQSVKWVDESLIIEQLEMLLVHFNPSHFKIGITENTNSLSAIIDKILKHNSKSKIIWDPVLKTSTGSDLLEVEQEKLFSILEKIELITPNYNESIILGNNQDGMTATENLAKYCKVLLKGGHNPNSIGRDYLFTNEKVYPFKPKAKNVSSKHGSGCVYASALTACLAKGYPLVKACLKAKQYTEKFLGSNKSLLGYHK